LDLETNTIIVKNLSKRFRILHEKHDTLYEHISNFFKKKNNYETLTVLDDISFSVKKGEMLGIIGFNGSGKTTLLKIISNIYTADDGEVFVNGKTVPFLALGTGFNGELTARDNIITYGIILGFTKREIESKINEIAKFSELESFLDTKLKNFSAGMFARLAFSTAIQIDPDVLLVDEILSVGDLPFQEKSFKKFMEFKQMGKTIVFVTHSVDLVSKYCDNAMWLHKGKIKSYGDPKEVIQKYISFSKEPT